VIELTATWNGGSRVKIEHAYEFRVVERDASAGPVDPSQIVAIAKTTLGCVDKAGKIRALPDWLAWEA
jgi:acyl-CoA thioesterase FadM